MGTRDYDLEEARAARLERQAMLESFAGEKKDLLSSHERQMKAKNTIVLALILANIVQASLLLGRTLGFSGLGVEVTTAADAEGELVPEPEP